MGHCKYLLCVIKYTDGDGCGRGWCVYIQYEGRETIESQY